MIIYCFSETYLNKFNCHFEAFMDIYTILQDQIEHNHLDSTYRKLLYNLDGF